MKQWLAVLLFLLALALVLFALSLTVPIVGDYFSFFRPTTLAFLRGESNLYDAASPGYYNAPWALAIWIPFVSFPYAVGQGAHELLYLLFLLAAVWLLQKDVPRVGILFALLNIPAFILLMAAGIDSFVLLGIALAYVAVRRHHAGVLAVALFILATKPQNVLLVIALCLYASRQWKAVWLPIASVIVSSLFIGLDWPLRYLVYLRDNPPMQAWRVELWNSVPLLVLVPLAFVALSAFAWFVWRRGFTEMTFSLAVATNLVFSPYVTVSHMVGLVPVLLFLARRNVKLALVLYLASWLIPVFGMAYPIAALVILWLSYGISTSIVKSTLTSTHSPLDHVPFGRAITPL